MKRLRKLCLIWGMAGSLLAGSVCTVRAEEYLYDALNRVTRVTYDDGSYVEYTYDKNGNITGVEVHKTEKTEPEQTESEKTEPDQTEKPDDKTASSTAPSDREARSNGEENAVGKNEGETKDIQGAEGAKDPEGMKETEGKEAPAASVTPAKGPGFWEKLFMGIKSLWERFVQWVRTWF